MVKEESVIANTAELIPFPWIMVISIRLEDEVTYKAKSEVTIVIFYSIIISDSRKGVWGGGPNKDAMKYCQYMVLVWGEGQIMVVV